MLSKMSADYGPNPLIALAPLSDEIAAEAARDEEELSIDQTPIGAGVAVAILPGPAPTPQPTAVLLPTPTLSPTINAPTPVPPATTPTLSAPTPVVPTPEPVPPTPTSIPPTPTPILPTPTPIPPTLTPIPPTPTPVPATSTPLPPTSEPPTSTPEPLPIVAFSAATFNVGEADSTATITVTLSAASAQVITVDYATSDLTATAGSDYTAISDTLSFAPGQTSLTFTVAITDDILANELDETVQLTLSSPGNATLGSPNPATLTIVDDDGQLTVDFSDPTYSVAEDSGPATITVTLSTPSVLTVTVDYATSDLTATAGSDYTTTSGTLSFAPGQTSLTFTVAITNDILANELDETVQLTLSNPNNAITGAFNPATLTIVDDDGQPAVDFSDPAYSVAEDSGPATITVTLSAPSALTVTVDFATNPGGSTTAIIGSDYIPISGTLIFTPGLTSQTFNVEIIDDAGTEADETVELELTNAVSATLGTTNNPATLTIQDNDASSCGPSTPPTLPNIGGPDCQWVEIAPGTAITITLASPLSPDGSSAFDLVYYERESPTLGEINLDLVVVEVATDTTGTWFTVFYWGDNITDTNTNIGQAPPPGPYGPPELANAPIPMTTPPLHQSSLGGPVTGIAIDLDNAPLGAVPPGAYRFIRISTPGFATDGSEVDAIQPFYP